MFGSSNPFGQASSSSPFGTQTQSGFGQSNNTSNNNPFAQKPFGTSTPFGAQTGSSMFGGTSTGVFGAPQISSPFGASTPAFGASSTPAFGNSTSTFGGSSTFGQKSFGLSTPQASPFGSTTQQSQPAFGNNTFGSSNTPAFGSSNTPAFGTSNTPAFGASSTPAFGATVTPAFGSSNTPAFGTSNTPAFGASSTSAFGATNTPAFGATSTPGFGASSTSAFGSTNTPAFGASSSPAFGASSSPAFGASPTPAFGSSGSTFGNNAFGTGGAFGASSTSAFGASSSPSLNFGSSPAFGQSTSAFGSTSFGSTQSSFGVQGSNSMFGGQSTIGGQQGGSRVMPYAPTRETKDSANTKLADLGTLLSISAMPVHNAKCQEELRWEDYQRGDKGGKSPGGAAFGVPNSQPSLFSVPPPTVTPNISSPFGQTPPTPSNPFGQQTPTNPSNPFGQQTPTNPSNPFGQQTPTNPSNPFGKTPTNPSNPFGQAPNNALNPFGQNPTTPSNPFGQNPTTPPNPFGQNPTTPSNPFGQNPTTPPNPFGQNPTSSTMFGTISSNVTSVFGSPSGFATVTPQPFGSAPAQGQGSTPLFSIGGNSNNSQPAPLFNSNPSPGLNGSAFGQNTTPGFGQTNNFSTPSTGFANTFSISPSLTNNITPSGQTKPTGLTSYQSVNPAQPLGAFSFTNNGQTQLGSTSFPLGSGAVSLGGNYGQVSAAPPSSVVMPIPVTNPFGTLPALPQVSIAQGGNSTSIQYGISSMPVVDKPAPVRVSPFLTCRHLSQRRVSLPTRKYRPGDDSPKVPFYEEENSNTPKADAFFIPRENPRALFIRPVERVKSAHPKDGPSPLQENGAKHENKNNSETREAPPVKAVEASPVKVNKKQNGTHENHGGEDKKSSYSSPSGADIKSLMPKLNHSEYFTEPRIQELAAKEKVDPGYCKRVKDFVVGRHGYGSIKFLGETDVCKLELEMLVQFQNREVNVYMDESKKPPVGQGLNKPAVVTLLNIKCMDKKSGTQVTEGVRLDKYKEMLKRKAKEQGAEFVSYDPLNGEWMFKVEHF